MERKKTHVCHSIGRYFKLFKRSFYSPVACEDSQQDNKVVLICTRPIKFTFLFFLVNLTMKKEEKNNKSMNPMIFFLNMYIALCYKEVLYYGPN